MKTSEIEERTQIWNHTAISILFLTKVPKTYDGEKTASSTSISGRSGYLPTENWILICAYHHVLASTKWVKDLNIRPETLQLVHERAGNTLEATGIGKDFLSRTPAAQ
jgi:hypothetical protein